MKKKPKPVTPQMVRQIVRKEIDKIFNERRPQIGFTIPIPDEQDEL